MIFPRASLFLRASLIALLLGQLALLLTVPAVAADEETVGGILVYKAQPWHKPSEALVKEYMSVRRFSTVLYVTEPGKKEQRLRQALVFEAHDYLPFDATDTVDAPLAAQIDREIASLKELAKRFPDTRRYVEPRIEKWESIQVQTPTKTAMASPSPVSSAAEPPALSKIDGAAAQAGKFHDTVLPVGGALGTIRLVNGEEFQAWITALTPTLLKWDEPIKEGSGVYQERVLPLTEVHSLQVYTAEDVARSQFRNLKVPKTSLTTEAYRVLYTHYFRLLEKMKIQFGSDPRYPEWHSEIIQVREDMEQAQSTQSLKLNGRWLTRREMQRDVYENSAKVLWASAMQMAELSHWRLAIEYCRELQENYPASRTFVENIPAMKKWLESFGKDRTSLRALSENPDVADQVAVILDYLDEFDLESAKKSLDLSARAAEAIDAGNRDEAERLLRESEQAWSRNREVTVLRQSLQALPAKK